ETAVSIDPQFIAAQRALGRISSPVLEQATKRALCSDELGIDADGGLGLLERSRKVFAASQPPGLVNMTDRLRHGDGKIAVIDGDAILDHRIRLTRKEGLIWV